MGSEPAPLNYYNYFTEAEEHFQLARGTSLFLLSPLDWALLETWKNDGVPLEAVLRGIDVAFAKWRSRKIKTQMVNSLAFCAQAVMTETKIMLEAGPAPEPRREAAESPFPLADLVAYCERNASEMPAGYEEIATSLRKLASEMEQHAEDLEALEQRLTVLEEKMIAIARSSQTEEALLESRQELDRQLKPYRGKMNASQLSMLEKQFLDRHVMEKARLPRLSLFYMR